MAWLLGVGNIIEGWLACLGGTSKRRRAWAAGLSAVMHVIIFALMFGTMSGSLVSAAGASGGPSGPVFSVRLVRLPSGATQSTDAPELQSLLIKVRKSATGEVLPTATGQRTIPFASLTQRLQNLQPPTPQASPDGLQAHSDPQATPLLSPDPPARNHSQGHDRAAETDGETAGGASTGDLWGAVEPCWRNLGARGRVPVVLEIALNGAGELRTPPRIIRSNTALIDEPRLQAEASALAAVAACIPRGGPQFGGKTFRLEFPAGR